MLCGQAEVEGVESPGGEGSVLLLPRPPEVAGGESDFGGEGQVGSGVGAVAACRYFIVAQVSSDSSQGFLKPCLEGLPPGLEGDGGIGKGGEGGEHQALSAMSARRSCPARSVGRVKVMGPLGEVGVVCDAWCVGARGGVMGRGRCRGEAPCSAAISTSAGSCCVACAEVRACSVFKGLGCTC